MLTARGEACGVAMGRGTLCCGELRLESYCSCEHEERGAGRAVCVRERGVETQRAKRSQRRVDVCHLGLEGHVWQVWCRLVVQVCGSWHLMSSSDTASSLLGLFWTGFQRRPLLQTNENCCRLSSVWEVIQRATRTFAQENSGRSSYTSKTNYTTRTCTQPLRTPSLSLTLW